MEKGNGKCFARLDKAIKVFLDFRSLLSINGVRILQMQNEVNLKYVIYALSFASLDFYTLKLVIPIPRICVFYLNMKNDKTSIFIYPSILFIG